MKAWQITQPKCFEKVTRSETIAESGELKIKTTKAMLDREDFSLFLGEDKVNYPIIPCKLCAGLVVETPENNFGLEKNTRVYLEPSRNCNNCYHCTIGHPLECSQLIVAGKNAEGFLKDFVVMPIDKTYPLPKSVTDVQALFIEYISLAISTIDKLNIHRGEHVAVIGGSVFSNILSQLIIYYQAVPIMIDDNDANLEMAAKSGIYYTLRVDSRVEKEVSELTGGRMASKVVYGTTSNLNSDIALKLSSAHGEIAFVGFSYSNIRVNFALAMQKQSIVRCITNGYGNTEASINLIANKAIDLSKFNLKTSKFSETPSIFKKLAEYETGDKPDNIILDMLN